MSDRKSARRTSVEVFFSGLDISKDINDNFLELTYTDNEDEETDDLQIKLLDRGDLLLKDWVSKAIDLASIGAEPRTYDIDDDSVENYYRVISDEGVVVRQGASETYLRIGSAAFGTHLLVKAISQGWARVDYFGLEGYVKAKYLQYAPIKRKEYTEGDVKTIADNGFAIQAAILQQNWDSDGTDRLMECGQFELDSVGCQGPPSVVTIKGTSLPYTSTIRQQAKSKSWEGYSLEGIATEIARRNGMTCMYSCSAQVWYKRVEQYKQPDIAFLETLCHNAGFNLKVTNNILVVFEQAAYEQHQPQATIEYGISDYKTYTLKTGKDSTYTACRVSYTEPSGRCISATAYIEDYKADSKNNQLLEVTQKVSSIGEAQALAEKILKMNNKFTKTASFNFAGNPNMISGIPVELKGFGAWDGKYIVKQAKHSVSRRGYTTTISLRRV